MITQRTTRGRTMRGKYAKSSGRHFTKTISGVNGIKMPSKINLMNPDSMRIIPLGGLSEIGKNMTAIEYLNEIIVIDAGVKFPEEDTPGIDLIIPNIAYLAERKKDIQAVIFTHGHFDHIGAVPYIIERLGFPQLYATPLTRGFILKRQEDFHYLPKLEVNEIQIGETFRVGHFTIETLHINHSVPDAVGLAITTRVGTIIHTGDFKFDETPTWGKPVNKKRLEDLAKENILLLMSDSTGAEEPGHSISDETVFKNLDEIFKKTTGRIICATFSSLITRIQHILTLAEKHRRKVVIQGFSMKANVEIARELKYLKIEKGVIIAPEETNALPPEKVLILGTGAQGEDNAMLMRIATQEHRHFRIQKGDTVIFSSSMIPGNERTIQNVKDLMYRQGANVIHYKMMDIHAGGHAQQEELKEMMRLTKPKFLMPIHGQYSMMANHKILAIKEGILDENIILSDNGEIISLKQNQIKKEAEWVPANYVMVDGLGIGDVGEVVLRDRQVLAKDGMITIIAVIDIRTGRVKGNPDIISRGFVYLRESKELLASIRKLVKGIVEEDARTSIGHPINWEYTKTNIREKIATFIFQKTERRPMVLPVVIEI